jgi:2,3-bisphosphoglycerate-independent phosphoglycerate mutase
VSVAPLAHRPAVVPPQGPVVLAILDGVGWGPRDGGDAVFLAQTPTLDQLWQGFPTRTLRAHGTAVGLPSDADMGNSEVGHNALGAGRVFEQGAALVGQAMASGRIWQTDTWKWLTELPAQDPAHTLHLCGLLSDGNVHAHVDHVYGLLRAADAAGVQTVRLHVLADGRDVRDPSFEHYIEQLQTVLKELGHRDYQIASGGGRMALTMDRYDADWAMVQRGWDVHVRGQGRTFASVADALVALRQEPGGQSDQTLPGFVLVGSDGQPLGRVKDGDSFVLWNFRGDRAIELTRAFDDDDVAQLDRQPRPDVRYAGMMQYDGDLHLPKRYLVDPPVIERTVGEYLAALGLRTFAVSETQKYGHVTYFWNGNRSGLLAPGLEEYAEVPSDRISFDKAPAMQAKAITDTVLHALQQSPRPDFVRLNYANGDMVGHTGDLAATIVAMQTVDAEVARLWDAVQAMGGILVVTADHGNADDMWSRDSKGKPIVLADGKTATKTSHTLNPVPLTIADSRPGAQWTLRSDLPAAGLANVAATLLHVLGYEAPSDYEPSVLV